MDPNKQQRVSNEKCSQCVADTVRVSFGEEPDRDSQAISERRFNDLLDAIQNMFAMATLKDCGRVAIAVGEGMLEKRTSYSPDGSLMLRLGKENLTICLARGAAAPLLSTAYDAIKEMTGCHGELGETQ